MHTYNLQRIGIVPLLPLDESNSCQLHSTPYSFAALSETSFSATPDALDAVKPHKTLTLRDGISGDLVMQMREGLLAALTPSKSVLCPAPLPFALCAQEQQESQTSKSLITRQPYEQAGKQVESVDTGFTLAAGLGKTMLAISKGNLLAPQFVSSCCGSSCLLQLLVLCSCVHRIKQSCCCTEYINFELISERDVHYLRVLE